MKPICTFEADGGRTMIRCDGRSLAVGWCNGCVPMDAIVIGVKLGCFRQSHLGDPCKYCGTPRDEVRPGRCVRAPVELIEDFRSSVHQIEDVLNTSDSHVARARGQIEDTGACTESLSDLDIAVWDVVARRMLSEAAAEIDDPFNPLESGAWSTRRTAKVPMPDWASVFDGYVGENDERHV